MLAYTLDTNFEKHQRFWNSSGTIPLPDDGLYLVKFKIGFPDGEVRVWGYVILIEIQDKELMKDYSSCSGTRVFYLSRNRDDCTTIKWHIDTTVDIDHHPNEEKYIVQFHKVTLEDD